MLTDYPLGGPRPRHIPSPCSGDNPQGICGPLKTGKEVAPGTQNLWDLTGSRWRGGRKEDFLEEEHPCLS